MKKILVIAMLLIAGTLYAQNSSQWQVRYYGDSYASSDSLSFAVGSSTSGEYDIPNTGIVISVDSNWTASNIGFEVYNYMEGVWEVLTNAGSALEYEVAVGSPVILYPPDVAGLKKVRFRKLSSGVAVNQSGSASGIQIASIQLN